MVLNLYECPECGWKGNFTPDECPVCGHNLVEHRANIKAEMRKEVQEAAERQKLEELEEEYREAIQLFNDGCLGDARVAFMALGDYKDSSEQVLICKYKEAESIEKEGRKAAAAMAFGALGAVWVVALALLLSDTPQVREEGSGSL